MAGNGYFELIQKDDKMWLKIHPPKEGGDEVSIDDIMKYMDLISFPDYDVVALDAYVKSGNFTNPIKLLDSPIIPERERMLVTIGEKGERALARFYPPSTDGSSLTEQDIVSDLKLAGIRHGIKKKAIEHFLANREYCRDYIIAKATPPIQGHDAKITYYFDVNVTAKPKLNEDGSVDFHQLGNIKGVKAGDKLAKLTPVDRGRAGISVLGKPIPAKKVKNRFLRFGRNIRISEDKCKIYSKVSGHVTLVDDMVMVSDIYKVPADVDASTGDIVYKGTVEVTGNVNTGYRIEAEGDIIVNGVVEGATLISGGNIVLKRGMQGMDKGELRADGNITAKFLENCKVSCKGKLKADAILHSEVRCEGSIDVLGRKGLINGGSVKTYAMIHATTLGSTMGALTEIEVLSEMDLIKESNSLREDIDEREVALNKMEQLAKNVKSQLAMNQEVSPEQKQSIKQMTVNKSVIVKELREMKAKRESLLERIEKNKLACIKVENEVYSGVNIAVRDVSKRVNESVSHCRFVRDGAEIRMKGL